jgi:predicted MPP superfamily phosphohydrolase
MKVVIGSDDWSVDYNMPSNDSSGSLTLIHTLGATYRNNITNIAYTDMAQDKTISDGDYLTITLSHEGSGFEDYAVSMVHVPSGFMDGIFFTW